MAWIESHPELARHPKTKNLSRVLGIDVPCTIGYLHLLWYWALDYAPDGDLSRWEDEEIAEGMMWKGDPAGLLQYLEECGFVNEDRTLHDWLPSEGRVEGR